MLLSVVIVNWNTREILRDCLHSVFADPGHVGPEVIVVDNASTDGSVEMIRTAFPQVRLIANATNRGFAAANNQGIAVARGRYVLLLNSDTIVLDDALARTVAFAEEHPRAAAIGCRVLNPDRSLQPTCFMFPSLANLALSCSYLNNLFPQSRVFGRERMTWWRRGDTRCVEVVTGCFLLARREAIEQVGLLDEGYFMYGEETDWCYRFRAAGWENLFYPDASIIHLGGQSSRQVRQKMIIELRLSILRFIARHKSPPQYWAACLMMSLWFAARVPVWVLAGLGRGQAGEIARQRAAAYLRGACITLARPVQGART